MRFAGTQLTNFFDPTNFDAIGKASILGGSKEDQALMQAEAYVDRAGIQAAADIEAAKFGASATRAQGSAAGQSAMFSGLGSLASGIAGGFASRPSGSGAVDYGFDPIGSQGNPLGGMGGRPLLNY